MDPLSLEDVATIRAELDGAVDPTQPLRARSLPLEQWQEAEEALLAELAEEVDRGELERLQRYQAVYTALRPLPEPISGTVEATHLAGSAPPHPSSLLIADEPTSLPEVVEPALPPTSPAVPFDPGAVAVVPVATAPKQQSGETREVDASDLPHRPSSALAMCI